jgi:hypothetical protein
MLEIGNVIAFFVQPGDDGLFELLEFIGVGLVVETAILIFNFHLIDETDVRVFPELMTLIKVRNVFVFNCFGVRGLMEIFGAKGNPMVGFRVAAAVVPAVCLTPGKGGLHDLPALPSISEGGFKARTNAMKCQNIKVLFHKDAAEFLEFAGPLEDTAGEHIIASIQSRVPIELLDLVILQPKQIKTLARLMFQMVEGEGGLHLSMFRKPSVIVNSTNQLKRCFETFTQVLKAMVGDNGYLNDVFFVLLEQLSSRASGCLCDLLPDILEHELSCRLVAFSKVLASATALTDDSNVLAYKLKEALSINMDELERLNLRRLCANMTAQLSRNAITAAGTKRKLEIDSTVTGKRGGGGDGGGSQRGLGTPGKPLNYCLSDVSFAYLGAVVLDGKPPLAKCSSVGCRFDHDIPVAPVSKEQKYKLLSVVKNIVKSPLRLEALNKVSNKPNFSV